MAKYKTLYPDAKILIIDDEPDTLFSFSTSLSSAGFRHIKTIEDSSLALDALGQDNYSCVLLDLAMPNISGKMLLPQIVHNFNNTAVIVMTGITDLDTIVYCMRNGAYDYMAKPLERARLVSTIEKAIQTQILNEENFNLKRGLLGEGLKHPEAFGEIITHHPKMKSIFAYLEAISNSTYPVMITGENGTGKELIAKSLHKLSGKKSGFVAINVAGLDDNLFSDTLFGHSKGAFTGANKERVGLIRKAEDGILFLDEIGDLELASQVKLLRLLQEREFQPLGSDKVYLTNARFVVSTNVDLEKAIRDKKFRQDLYYRLKTHSIHIPPLRERLSDLPLLIKHITMKHAKIMGKGSLAYPPQLVELLSHYHFPGNVRELESMLADAVARTSNNILPLKTFLSAIKYNQPDQDKLIDSMEGLYPKSNAVPTLKEVEAAHISYVLRITHNNLTVAAKLLGMNYSTLYRRLKRTKLKQLVSETQKMP